MKKEDTGLTRIEEFHTNMVYCAGAAGKYQSARDELHELLGDIPPMGEFSRRMNIKEKNGLTVAQNAAAKSVHTARFIVSQIANEHRLISSCKPVPASVKPKNL